MCKNLKYDYRRFYHKTTYKGTLRKFLMTLGSPGFQAVMGYRMCRWMVQRRIPFLYLFIQRFVEITTGIFLPADVIIGKGLLIMHFGGIVINSGSVIGENCTILHGVTIGNQHPGGKSPVIGDHVYICAGAKVLGDITVGDYCVIGANAVLTKSIPAYSVAAGIPAKVIKTLSERGDDKEFSSDED